MPSQLDVDKIRHTNGTDALTFDTSGNTNLQKDLKFSSTAAIKNSSGNNILSESGGTITLTTNSAVIEGSSSGNLVRITQTGSGNALVVEDSANPDNTPFVVNASGVVGIGTSSPNEMMTIASSSVASYLQICDSSTGSTSGDGLFLGSFNGAAELRTKENTHLSFGTNNTQHMRIDSNGNVGIGTVEPLGLLDIRGTSGGLNGFQRYGTLNVGSIGATGGSLYVSTDSLNESYSSGLLVDGSYSAGKSLVNIKATGVTSGGPYSADLVFHTQSETTISERMRINSGGAVLVGTATQIGLLTVNGTIASGGYVCRSGVGGSYGGNSFNIYWTGSVPQLWIDATNTGTIQVSSDYRIKKNIETQTASGIDRVMRLRPVTYEIADYGDLFRADGIVREGFIAHEVQKVIPSGAEGQKDEEGRIQNLRADAILSVAIKAIQEQQALIESQQSQIDTLTTKTQEQDLTIASLISRIEALETN